MYKYIKGLIADAGIGCYNVTNDGNLLNPFVSFLKSAVQSLLTRSAKNGGFKC